MLDRLCWVIASVSQPGQAFVELALILVSVLFLCLATIDMGDTVVSYLTVAHAARDGARVGTIAANLAT